MIRLNNFCALSSKTSKIAAMTSIRFAQTSSNVVVTTRLTGKTAVVTASTKGIGYAAVERLAQEGARVIVSSRKKSNVEKAVETLKGKGYDVTGVVCHVGNKDDRDKLIKKAVEIGGKIDILVSNAAVNPAVGPILDTSEEVWDKIFDINVKSAFLITKEALPHIPKGGSIVYIASIAGLQPFPLLATYSVSKTALIGLSKAVSTQCAPLGIRVNCISPGIIKTDFSSALWQEDSVHQQAKASVPLNRLAEPHEVASLVAFLCSDDASYVTGENYVVAGGMPSRL